MVSKRCLNEENDDSDVPILESKRHCTFPIVVREVMKGLSIHKLSERMEPFLRNLVRKEVEHAIQHYITSSTRPSGGQIEASRSRGYELHFLGRLPHTLFTNSKIESEDGTPIQIVIRDAGSKEVITSGPLSSVRVEIVSLGGKFGTEELEDWTAEQFHASVIHQREGRRPLLTGTRVVTLKDGAGCLGNITITDNSSWSRTRKFRLGARAVQNSDSDDRIKGARSEAFVVKDSRGEIYKKHYPPSLDDEIWRLEKIRKDGVSYNRLTSHEIRTVQDFLRHLTIDQSFLRTIFGKRMSSKTWEIIVNHAKTCILDNKLYIYYDAVQQVGLQFNSIYEVVSVTFDGHSFQSLENLMASQMNFVENLKQVAYRNKVEIVEFDGHFRQLPLQSAPIQGSNQGMQCPDALFILPEQLPMKSDFHQLTNTETSVMGNHGEIEEVSFAQGLHTMQVCTPIQGNSFMKGSCIGHSVEDGSKWGPGGPIVPAVSFEHLTGDDICQVQWQGLFADETQWGEGSGFFVDSRDEGSLGLLSSLHHISPHISKSRRLNMGWFKLKAAIKLGISHRRNVAARRQDFCSFITINDFK